MTRDDFLMLMDRIDRGLRVLTNTKGTEYPQSDDQLANFKRIGFQLGLRPEMVLWVYLEKHLDALRYAIGNRKANYSEPLEDRINDAILYLVLLQAILTDSG